MNDNWSEFTNEVSKKKIICYGAGTNALLMLENYKFKSFLDRIKMFVDIDKKKHNTKIYYKNYHFDILSTDELDTASSEIVLVTLSDYITVGKMLSDKNITWFSWTLISNELNLSEISLKINTNKTNFFLLNTPDYINLGDQAIAFAETIYLNKNFGNFIELGTHICDPNSINALKKYINPNDIIFFQGGGNLGSLWRVCEEIFRNILVSFPLNKIIVFPQSIYYGNTEEEQVYFKNSIQIYNSHLNLLICTRDERSYNFVKNSYNCKCLLLPDIALTLNFKFDYNREGIGVLFRNDKEQFLPYNYKETVISVINQMKEKNIDINHHPVDIVSNRSNMVKNILKTYSKCRLIITDRLHGMVFSALTNTPCIVFNNSYGKIFDLYDVWLKDIKSITFTNLLPENELLELVKQKLTTSYDLFNSNFFENKFEELTKYIRNIIEMEDFYV